MMADGVVHDAQIQTVEIYKPSHPTARGTELNFRDSYQYNIAAYRLSRMLKLDMVPVSVERKVEGKSGAVTWWIDNVLMSEKTRYLKKIAPPDRLAWNRQIYCVRVFDQLIYNTDRNLGNLLITEDWKLWMIDHTRAFRRHKKIDPKQLVGCDRQALEAMRGLSFEALHRELGGYLNKSEITALLARREAIVEHFDAPIQARGESAVLFDLPGAAAVAQPR